MTNNIIPLPASRAASASAEAISLAKHITSMLGISQLPFHADQIAHYLRAGFEAEMLMMAAESAIMAPAPSWAYFRGILRRCAIDRCHTAAQYTKRLEEWRGMKELVNYQYGKPNKWIQQTYGS